jgi:hypothetical protein
MRLGLSAGMVLAALMMVTAPAAAAYAASTPTGNDVSYPQCGQALPSGQAFGIVAVNEGVANTTNPCLATEITWAQASSDATSQPRVSLYVNTADPGNHGVTDWPATNNNPLGGKLVSDPYGTCRGANNPACAWQYGWNLAELDAQTRGVPNPGRYRWWLDVETINSWESSSANNRADLEGMTSYFRRIGGNVGIYSTPKQWDPIVGTVRPNSPLYRLPDWIPGATTLSRAKKNCSLAPLTGGGTVTVVQWSNKPVNRDLACRAPSPKRAGTR